MKIIVLHQFVEILIFLLLMVIFVIIILIWK
jgi:hypothetical protein